MIFLYPMLSFIYKNHNVTFPRLQTVSYCIIIDDLLFSSLTIEKYIKNSCDLVNTLTITIQEETTIEESH